jgi:hypothetical protein
MKIHCTCGATIHDGTDELPHKAHVIPDQLWNKLFDDIDDLIENRCATATQRNAACTKIRALVGVAVRLGWQCTACGRLHLDDAGHQVQTYAPETPDTPRELFRAVK